MKAFLLCCAAVFPALFASGAIVLFDGFNYSNGPVVGAPGSPWAGHSGSGAGDEALVTSGKLQVASARSEDINAPASGQPYTSAGSTNVFYASFTVRFSALPTSGGAYFAHFKDSGTGFRARIWALTNGAAPGAFRLGISSTSGSVISATNPTDLALNADYKIVTRLVNTSSIATLWIAPATEASPSVSTSEGALSFTVVAYAFRQNSGEGTMLIDDLLVGTAFADVISTNSVSAPVITAQPQSQTVVEGATVNFEVVASGTAPLNFQWQFNGTNITNALSSSLSLTNVMIANAGNYSVAVGNSAGSTNSQSATLTVNSVTGQAAVSVLTYNTKGNGATNWATNAPQVQAIGRQMQYLQPDIITFQEIPLDLSSEMTNFITAYLPGYYLARNSGSDGFIRSAIASRFPITRSTSWLDAADLKPFGYTNTSSGTADNFTRDLFEAQISVPDFPQPLHVFTTHLKSSGTNYTDAAAKRAAEAAAITNFFASSFFVSYPNDPYLLTGDMNEANTNTLAIQRLLSAPTGLLLTNPRNPVTSSINTFSIQASLSSRIDYIFPCGLLFSNIVSSQVFRTDLLNPVPPGVQANDDVAASDHLPVLMFFSNPYYVSFEITSVSISNQLLTLNWQSSSGQQYRVENSTTLTNWVPFSGTLTASGTNVTFSTNVSSSAGFLRIYRFP